MSGQFGKQPMTLRPIHPIIRQILGAPLRPFGEPFETPQPTVSGPWTGPTRQGEDLMLTDVLAWDLRVYDPGAPLVGRNGAVMEPSDAGWDPSHANASIVGFGAYVDIGWDQSFDPNNFPQRCARRKI